MRSEPDAVAPRARGGRGDSPARRRRAGRADDAQARHPFGRAAWRSLLALRGQAGPARRDGRPVPRRLHRRPADRVVGRAVRGPGLAATPGAPVPPRWRPGHGRHLRRRAQHHLARQRGHRDPPGRRAAARPGRLGRLCRVPLRARPHHRRTSTDRADRARRLGAEADRGRDREQARRHGLYRRSRRAVRLRLPALPRRHPRATDAALRRPGNRPGSHGGRRSLRACAPPRTTSRRASRPGSRCLGATWPPRPRPVRPGPGPRRTGWSRPRPGVWPGRRRARCTA